MERNMNNDKVIAVVGATGAQGSGLVHAILNDRDGGFSVRALKKVRMENWP
jgi:nucleoside-diphosphate-sugar epimerase